MSINKTVAAVGISLGVAAAGVVTGAGTASAITASMCLETGGKVISVQETDGGYTFWCWGSGEYPMWQVFPGPGETLVPRSPGR